MWRVFPLLLLVLAGCGGTSTPPTVLLGHVAPLSGPERPQGEQALRGIHLAVRAAADEPAKGLDRPVQVLHADAGHKPEIFEAEAVRLTAVNRVAALLGGFTPAQVEKIEQESLVLISPSGLRTGRMGKKSLLLGLTPEAQGKALAQFTHQELLPLGNAELVHGDALVGLLAPLPTVPLAGLGSVVRPPLVELVVDGDDEFSRRAADSFATELRAASSTFGHLRVERRAPGEVVKRTEVPAWISGRVVVLALPGARLAELAETTRSAAAAQVLLASEIDLLALQRQGRLTDRDTFALSYHPDVDPPQNKAFVERYRQAYREDPGVAAALMYDGTGMLLEAIRQCGNPFTTARLREKLSGLKDYPGLTGPISVTDDFQVRRPLFLVRQQRDRLELVRRVEPG